MEGVPTSFVSYHLQHLAQLCWPPCLPSCQLDLPTLPGASDVGSPLQAALFSSPDTGGPSVPGTAWTRASPEQERALTLLGFFFGCATQYSGA